MSQTLEPDWRREDNRAPLTPQERDTAYIIAMAIDWLRKEGHSGDDLLMAIDAAFPQASFRIVLAGVFLDQRRHAGALQ